MKVSPLERQFRLYWRGVNGPELTPEFRFHPKRRWRFDFAHTVAKVAFEVEGGVWTGGRHTRGAGFIEDCEKKNEAQLLGWQVFQITRHQLNIQTFERLAQHVRTRALQFADPYQCPEPSLPTSHPKNSARNSTPSSADHRSASASTTPTA